MTKPSTTFNNKDGDNRPKPTAQKKKKKRAAPKSKFGKPVIAGLILGGLSTMAIVIAELSGHWHDSWVTWGLIPVALIALAIWLYEILLPWSKSRWVPFCLAGVALVVLGSGIIIIYVWFPLLKWQPPELPEKCEDVFIIFGGNPSGQAIKDLKTHHFLVIGDFEPFKARVENNRFYVDVDIPVDRGLIEVRGNKILGQLPEKWEMNCNSNAMEIVTENSIPVYQIFYKRPDEVAVNGILVHGSTALLGRPGGMEYAFVNRNVAKALSEFYNGQRSLGLKPIFKYPAWRHPGEYEN